jgi:hypothetical protein
MNLQHVLDSSRLVLRTQSPRDLYESNQVATNIYVKSMALTCSTTFGQNLNSCTTQLYLCNDTFDGELRR